VETTASELVGATRAGQLTCVQAVADALARMHAGAGLGAWTALDGERALEDAVRLDREGPRDRPLFGLPIGVKDIFDTAGLVTSYGSPVYAGHIPTADAAVVAALREAGAIVVGKTATTELATLGPTAVRNPLAPDRSPGGSSSGSAAAVGAGHVPAALGTQTAGSIIRPASYCAAVGYKPTFGAVTRAGVLPVCDSLDTVGCFARSVADVVLLMRVMAQADPRCPTARRTAPVSLPERLDGGAPLRLAVARTPHWELIEDGARDAIEALFARLSLPEVALPADFDALTAAQQTVQQVETAQSLARDLPGLGEELAAFVRAGLQVDAESYARARHDIARIGWECREVLGRVDALLTPSTTGPPPPRPQAGDPVFCRAWTAIGAPCVAVPVAVTAERLPAGLQVVSAPGADDRVLRAAAVLLGEGE
jgi:amidase